MSKHLPPDPWVGAACKSTADQLTREPDYGYPQGPGRARHWKELEFINKFCNSCPIIQKCREYGKNQEYGIWGGTTEKDRQNISSVLKMFG